ncbi:MAG: hypothetical protein ABH864_04560 [archaeon]
MNKASKIILTIVGVLAIFILTKVTIPDTDLAGISLSPASLHTITIMDAIWCLSALAVSVAYWHWLWKK